jgi:hypothetical protein
MAREQRRFWLGAGAALLAGLSLRLWFVYHLARVAGDSLVYGDIAKNLLLHRVYGFTEQGPTPGSTMIRSTLIRLPGYPLFLAACFRLFGMEHYGAVLYVQLAADLLTCALAAALAGRLFGRRARLPVLWLATLCPFTASYVATPLTETLTLTSTALAFYGFARWQEASARGQQEACGSQPAAYNRWLWLLAAALAASILLRPEQGLLAAAVLPAMLWVCWTAPQSGWGIAQRATGFTPPAPNPRLAPRLLHSAAPVAAAALCILLPFLPWTARNWHTFHVFEPLAPRAATDPGEQAPDGFNRWYRTWAIEFASTEDVYWNYDGSRIELADLPARAFALGCYASHGVPRTSQPLYAATAALFDDYNQQTAASPEFDARFAALARQRIHAAPICYYLALPVARLLNMAFRPRSELMPIAVEWWKPPTPLRQTEFAAAYAALNLAYFLLAFAGLRAFSRSAAQPPGSRQLILALAASLVLRSALLLTLDNSEARYTIEFFPVLFVWAGGLFSSARKTASGRSKSPRRLERS